MTIFCAATAQAQSAGSAGSPGADLRRQMEALAQNPGSVSELIATGRAALEVGDGEAALGFFARANQLAPRDARVKAGLAAANARTGRPDAALPLFAEAVSLGAPEGEIAAERGLAYDLLGQTARAQQDYVRALRHREDPEVRRRMALSLAISGQREAALRLIEDQVRQGDRAGNRARVMVLALSGDVRGATAAANASLPSGAAQAITPFLSRLASLSPGQMASAANLGRVPASGAGIQMAGAGSRAADPGALAFAGGGTTAAPAFRSRLPVATPPATGTRRRPGAVETAARSVAPATAAQPARQQSRVLASSAPPSPSGAADPRRNWSAPATVTPSAAAPAVAAASVAAASAAATTAILQPHPHQPLRLLVAAAPGGAMGGPQLQEPVELAGAGPEQPRVPQAVLPAGASDEPVLTGAATDLAPAPTAAPTQAADQSQLAAVEPARQPAEPAPAPAQQAEPAAADPAASTLAVWNSGSAAAAAGDVPAAAAASRPGFSAVVATVSALPVEVERASAAPLSRPQRTASAAPASVRAPAARTSPARPAAPNAQTNAAARTSTAVRAARTPQQAHPSRVWVQLGVAPSRAGFGYEISRMRRAAPDLLQNRQPHVAPIGSSHRLLVGPFANEAAARTFINGLKSKNIAALSWTSPAGTEVERFAAGR
jgi:Flp pilus assembly protein TadD